jgi:hypothetical protein
MFVTAGGPDIRRRTGAMNLIGQAAGRESSGPQFRAAGREPSGEIASSCSRNHTRTARAVPLRFEEHTAGRRMAGEDQRDIQHLMETRTCNAELWDG